MIGKKKILVIGSSNMDLSLNMYKIPEPKEIQIDDGGVAYTPGGKGLCTAVALSRLGTESFLTTKLGRDLHGQQLFSYIKQTDINTSYIKVDGESPTGFAAILKEPSGDARTVYYPGANLTLSRENLAEAFSCMPDAVYISFEVSFETAALAARMASAKGIPVFIDASPANSDFNLEALPEVEVFSPNEVETEIYTGVVPAGADSSLRAALALWKRVKCKYLVIKQGSRGAFIYDGKHYSMIPSYRPDKIADAAGVGDAFNAALIYEYLESGDITLAAKYGVAAGAVAISRPGATSSMPTQEEIIDFLRKRPEQY